jgi:hypothetical protein
MNVLILVAGADTGGQGINIKRAFDRFAPDWSVRSASVISNYMAHDPDLTFPRDQEEIVDLYERADVVHLRNSFGALRLVGAHTRRAGEQKKPLIIHHHGSRFRRGAVGLMREAAVRGAASYVSTMDLLLKDSELRLGWIPAPVDVDGLAAMRKPQKSDVIRIGHAPTNRTLKGTAHFLAACAVLQERGRRIEPVIIEGKPWRECVELKGTVDLFYDQLMFGYGNNGLEAFAMGIPVVSGAVDPKVLSCMRELVGDLPFLPATHETLADQIEALIISGELREEYAARGRAYVERFHAPAKVVARLQGIYREAAAVAA